MAIQTIQQARDLAFINSVLSDIQSLISSIIKIDGSQKYYDLYQSVSDLEKNNLGEVSDFRYESKLKGVFNVIKIRHEIYLPKLPCPINLIAKKAIVTGNLFSFKFVDIPVIEQAQSESVDIPVIEQIPVFNGRWGTLEQQKIMYADCGKKAVVISNPYSYPDINIGDTVIIDHQYSVHCTDVYVNDFDGNCLGRLPVCSFVIPGIQTDLTNKPVIEQV